MPTTARQRHQAKRRAFFLSIVGTECASCGATEHLEFDHIEPNDKKYEISWMPLVLRHEEVMAELAKCQTLCRECHTAKTAREHSARMEGRYTHGTEYAIVRKKCQCAECDAARETVYAARAERRRKEGGRGKYGQPSTHGEQRHYGRGCRCDLCKQANADYYRARRATTPS